MKSSPNNSDILLSHLDYLEEIEGPKALDFVQLQNQITDKRLKTDKRYKNAYNDILKIVSSKDKLPTFFLIQDTVYSFWQDNKHIKGILRRTSIKSFNSGKPKWITVLDLDLLSKKENENWVYKGINCFEPDYDICLIGLSRGGKDARVQREFNLKTRQFVKNGFYIPESKSEATWVGRNLLLVGDATEGSPLSHSGYPTQIKVLNRGESLKDSRIVFSVPLDSMSAYSWTKLIKNKRYITFANQKSFFEAEIYNYDLKTSKITRISIPKTADIAHFNKYGLFFTLREKYLNYESGTLLSLPLDSLLSEKPQLTSIFVPNKSKIFEYATFSKNHLWIGILNDVTKKVLKFSYKSGAWIQDPFDLPEHKGNISINSAHDESHHLYFHYSDFLTPTSILYFNETKTITPKTVLATPHRFKSKDFQVSQFKVASQDGTLIPYFIISNKKIKFNSQNPTLLYGYGGFEISMTPAYLGSTGKVWLEKGGVYVLSNIRGGGEYGPDWHKAALRENRHKAYEDFYAIAEDLIKRKITSPRHLGIRGGSNGGLLTSVAFTQRPELFNAVISEVPLANMLEYHKWLAGASWIEEYGDPDDKKMRSYLLTYSPLHNLNKHTKYPEVFYLTSTKDDRVSPAHARQMVARMLELGLPVLYNENTNGGHGRAANVKDTAEYLALEFTYLYQKLF